LYGGFGKISRVVLRDCRLKLAIQNFALIVLR
jgi:hypothetical protein